MLHTIGGGKSPQKFDAKGVQNLDTLVSSPDDLTDALTDTERMESILMTLLEARIIDIGNRRQLTVGRQDASDDIRFAARQLLPMLARTGDIWRAIPMTEPQERPWKAARRLGKELSAVLVQSGNGQSMP